MKSNPAVQSSDCYHTIPPPAFAYMIPAFLAASALSDTTELLRQVLLPLPFTCISSQLIYCRVLTITVIMVFPCVASQYFSSCVFSTPRQPIIAQFIYICMKQIDKFALRFFAVVLIALMLCVLCGCRTKTVYVPVRSSSTITEVRRDSLVYVHLPALRDSVSASDTLSILENSYASSIALWSGNHLSHSLSVKAAQVPVSVQYVERFRTDSIAVPYPVERVVEKNVLRWWQKALMYMGALLLIYLIVKVGGRCFGQ